MLLILTTALMGFYAKRFSTVPLFAIVSHIVLGVLYSFSSFGGNDKYIEVIFSALLSLVIGLILYGWMFWYKRKHEAVDIRRIKIRMTKILGTLIFIAGLLNIWIIYQGIENGKRLVEKARLEIAEAQNAKIQETQSIDVKEDISAPSQNQKTHVQNASTKSVPYKQGGLYEDGSVFLYREPVEIYWNDWTGIKLLGDKAYISGQGKTVQFDGVVSLNCQSPPIAKLI